MTHCLQLTIPEEENQPHITVPRLVGCKLLLEVSPSGLPLLTRTASRAASAVARQDPIEPAFAIVIEEDAILLHGR